MVAESCRCWARIDAVYYAFGKLLQLFPAKLLHQIAQEAAGLPGWLFNENYDPVGSLAETIALLLRSPASRPA